MSENVVTTDDVAPVKVPKSFNDLNKEQLVTAANYFGTETDGNKEVLKADLLECGVTFEQYLEAFYPDTVEKDEESTKFEMPEPVDVNDWPDADEGGDEVTEPVTVAPQPELAVSQKYLIKFVGQNPYFEFGRYKFTSDKPYGIMPAEDAQRALVEEPTKFRQAFPDELREYYDA